MKISMIGTGYVGLVTGTLFADRGNKVVCVDKKINIINQLNSGKIHIYEPGLEKLVQKNVANNNLSFTTNLQEAVQQSDLVFLAVGTPSNEDGSFNLDYLLRAASDVGEAMRPSSKFKVVVCKSTVPQGTSQPIIDIINKATHNPQLEWAYVSNPETLAEGTAISNFSKPDRIIIGTGADKVSDHAFELICELYHPFNIKSDRIMRGSPADAELAKLFSNTALAARIALINEFARISDLTPNADMDIIRRMICEDVRIGYNFMFPSPGYGGSCFPKDVQGVVAQAKIAGYIPLMMSQIHPSNEAHKNYIGERVAKLLQTKHPKIGVWGLTFKPNTDDMRDAASIPILTRLINSGAEVFVYDPQDHKAREIFGDRINYTADKYAAIDGADALILLTEWKEFDAPDFNQLKRKMRGSTLFDLRNRWLPAAANRQGFNYYGIGRSYPLK